MNTLRCPRCEADVEPSLRWRTDAGGRPLIEATCPRCRKWLKWLAQTPENIARTVTDDGPDAAGRQGTLFGES